MHKIAFVVLTKDGPEMIPPENPVLNRLSQLAAPAR
jgi:hypothetical protein